MRIYLDNCVFNRPFDKQDQIRIRLEAEAKLHIQNLIQQKRLELVWSYILELENQYNPYVQRRNAIKIWKTIAVIDVLESEEILKFAMEVQKFSINSKDALHIACAIEAESDFFITTDHGIIKKLHNFSQIRIISPLEFIELQATE